MILGYKITSLQKKTRETQKNKQTKFLTKMPGFAPAFCRKLCFVCVLCVSLACFDFLRWHSLVVGVFGLFPVFVLFLRWPSAQKTKIGRP